MFATKRGNGMTAVGTGMAGKERAALEERLRTDNSATLPTDGEVIATLSQAIRPSVMQDIAGQTVEQLNALEMCLLEQQRLLAGAISFPGKETIVHYGLVAQSLCKRVQTELGGSKDERRDVSHSPAA
jgi:hypothetical protein